MKMTSRFALVAAAATLLGAYSANAADLGRDGGCCADLEDRVAELEATTARKGNRVVSLQIYGNVSRELVRWDADFEGESFDDFEIIDENGSKFGLRGSATIKPGMTAGYNIEISTAVDQGDPLKLRKNNVWIESEQLGRVTLGEQSSVTDGIAHIVLGNSYQDSGSFLFDFYGDFDGARGDYVRYDSPSIAGFILSANWTNDASSASDLIPGDIEEWSVTLRYSGEFNAFRIAAGIGYSDFNNDFGPEGDILQGSASIMHIPTGLFAAFSAGNAEVDNSSDDSDYWYAQAGIEKTWLSVGATTLYAEYGDYDNLKNVTSELWGVGFTQAIDAAAMDIYVQYRNVDADEFDSGVSTFLVGTNINF